MNEVAVQKEYERLGYEAGWAFAMTPVANIVTASVVLVGLNPGGDEGGAAWEFADGNAYLDQVWTKNGSPTGIQTEVRCLLQLLCLDGPDLFAGQFIPFRSRDINGLKSYPAALEFALLLWKWVIAGTSAYLFICMGQEAAKHIAVLTGAVPDGSYASGWGMTKVIRYVSPDGRVVVSLPHPSRYLLLGPGRTPQQRRAAKLAILQAARPGPNLAAPSL